MFIIGIESAYIIGKQEVENDTHWIDDFGRSYADDYGDILPIVFNSAFYLPDLKIASKGITKTNGGNEHD